MVPVMETKIIERIYTKLFLGDPRFVELIPDAIKGWFVGTALKYGRVVQSREERAKLLHKLIHSKKVFDAGLEIIESPSQGFVWNKVQGAVVCLLHDIGRFYQATTNSFFDDESKIDHASAGAEMFSAKGFTIPPNYECDERVIKQAIYYHSRCEYSGSDPYAKLVRDADKIGIFREFGLQERFAKRSWSWVGFSKEILDDVLNRKMCDYRQVKSVGDFTVLFISWLWDLNFSSSRLIAVKEKFPDLVRQRLTKYGLDEASLKKVNQVLLEFENGSQ